MKFLSGWKGWCKDLKQSKHNPTIFSNRFKYTYVPNAQLCDVYIIITSFKHAYIYIFVKKHVVHMQTNMWIAM